LRESKKVFAEADKNLFYKIVLGDKSDNISPVFKKCGPKTCEKYYENKDLFLEALNKENGAKEKYELNKKIISFDEIPENFVDKFLQDNKKIVESF
jgi:5'-3' exonuclease